MRIISSDVAFNMRHQKDSTESVINANNSTGNSANSLAQNGSVMTDTHFTFSANMYSNQSSHFNSQSIITQGSDRAIFEKNQTTQAIVRTSIGFNAQINNIRSTGSSLSLSQPNKSNSYLDVQNSDTTRTTKNLNLQVSSSPQQARVEITQQHFYQEQEQLHIGTQGSVMTADGQKIDFMLQLDMHREFSLEQSLAITTQQREVVDPLIINLGGGSASLTSHSFSFDLNADGENEEISFAGQGSGFLAFDKNSDGKINDGSELFGATGLNGFADLAKYDDDGNKWIDENDAIFADLKVWTRDENNQDQLISLKDAGVGAIYLGASTGSFDLSDSENNLLGQVKRSGIFLTQQGQVASIQEIDLALHSTNLEQATSNTNVQNSIDNINQKLANIQQQFQQNQNDWQFISLPSSNDKNINSEEHRPTLIELLFPKLDSDYYQAQQTKKVERQLERTSNETLTSANNHEPDTTQPFFKIDQTTIDMMQRLEEKTLNKLSENQQSHSNLRAIIKQLAEHS
ncbi:hypothetical protein WN093_08145 [Gammaproteobacteria bacterium AS21]